MLPGLLLALTIASHNEMNPSDPDWKVGLARMKITPAVPVHLAGYASRNRPFEKVEADIYVKAMALEDAAGYRAVLITSDLLGFSAAVAEPICARIQERTGLKRQQILLSSSHTHTGPMLSLDPAARGNVKAEDAAHTVAYTRELQDKVVEAAAQALAKMEPARLSWGVGVVSFVMNRREFTPNGVILGVNPRGPVDRSVPVLRVDSPDGVLRAVLFGAACHNTTLTGQHYVVSGDYAGFAQTYLEENLPGAQAMFILGCAGDANPYPRSTLEDVHNHGETLGQEVERVLGGKLQPVRGPLRTACEPVDLPLQTPPGMDVLEKWAAESGGWRPGIARQMLETLKRGEKLPTQYRTPVSVWQFGQDLTLVGLPGEVVVDYVLLLEEALGPLRLWIAAYCNDVFGYFPSTRVLREEGYETRGLYAGGLGFFEARAQDVLVAKVKEMAGKVGRR